MDETMKSGKDSQKAAESTIESSMGNEQQRAGASTQEIGVATP